jgi:hypothetical protein
MTANHDLERRIADFYASEAPQRAPEWVLRSALETVDNTKQRRAFIRVLWRFSNMNNYARLAVAAVAVIAVGFIGLAVLRPGTAPGVGGPGPSPSPSPPSISPRTSSSPLPALTETFTSTINGISVGYPAGWKIQRATEPWTTGLVQQGSPFADVIYEKEQDSPFIAVASQPLGGKTADQWRTDYLALTGASCAAPEPVTVDGASGVLDDCEFGPQALVSVGGRGYLIWLYRIDDFDWFKENLATVKLHPEDAVTVSPSPSR